MSACPGVGVGERMVATSLLYYREYVRPDSLLCFLLRLCGCWHWASQGTYGLHIKGNSSDVTTSDELFCIFATFALS
jgi:hypothetical protein